MDWLQLMEKTGEQFFPRFILTVCKLQPEILMNIIKYPLIVKMYNQCIIAYFIILRVSGLSLHTVRINPRKNSASLFSIANHQQFCNIFSTNYWVGYFLPQLVSAGIFFIQNCLAGNFFQNHPPPHQKLNGQPLIAILGHSP